MSKELAYSEYAKHGFSKKQINNDIVFTLQNRLWNMTEREKNELGITDSFLDSTNLYQMLSMGRIELIMDRKKSNKPFPVFHMKIDFDGDGVWSNVSPVNSSTAFRPMHTLQTNRSMTKERVYQEVVNRKYNSLKNTIFSLDSQQMLDENPSIDAAMEAVFRGIFITQQKGTQASDRIKTFLNENSFFSAILPELDLSQDIRIDELTQEIQKEAILMEQMMPELREDYNIASQQGLLTKGDEMVYTQNIFFDHTMKNEGGFYATAYAPSNEWDIINSDYNPDYIKYEYLSKKDENGKYVNDPTIGYGFSLNDKFVVNALIEKKYDIDLLLKGEQKLLQKDAIDVAYNVLNTKYNEIKSFFGENVVGDRNTYLAMALVDLNYVSGFGEATNSFIGNRMKQAFENYFNATTDEERAAALGSYDSYLEGTDIPLKKFSNYYGGDSEETFHKKNTGGITKDQYADYTPTILNELYNDGVTSKSHRGRLELNAKLIQAWDSGKSTMFQAPIVNDSLPSTNDDLNTPTINIDTIK
jgi:hypothetical protein